ncbi:MAG TPA: phosphate acyltransferase PlsX [Clostridiales bacterium]|nr:phosphate acyltransferase PlsX [Clostridiales bacterium]
MKILVDAFGGDHAPSEIIKGAIDALKNNPDIKIILSGKQDVILKELENYTFDSNRLEILEAQEIISNDEHPTSAIRDKKESSLVKGLYRLKEDPQIAAMISAGSTGAFLTGAMLIVGRLDGIDRPALAPVLPTITRGHTMLIDCGANMDSKPDYFVQFAIMGSAYMQSVFNIESPRVGLLSVGIEDEKGNAQTKAALELLKKAPINFKGNMEARDALSGDYDVVVSDGFAGNVMLKSIEGAVNLILTALKQAVMERTLSKIGAALMKPAFKQLKERLDYNQVGGAPFLGCKKIVIKTHGSSKASSITAAILQAHTMAKMDLIGKIKSGIEKLI